MNISKDVISREGRRVVATLRNLKSLNNIHLERKFMELSENTFFNLLSTSMKNSTSKSEEISRVVNYFESFNVENFRDTLELESLSPKIRLLFFKSINQTFLKFKKTYES